MKKRKKDKKSKKFTIYKFFGIILILSSIALLGIVLYINILPLKYLVVLLGVLLFINIICFGLTSIMTSFTQQYNIPLLASIISTALCECIPR